METRMLSSVYGEIQELLVVFPGLFTAASEAEYEGITQAFHPRGTVHQFLLSDPDARLSLGRSPTRGEACKLPPKLVYRTVNQIAANLDLYVLLARWKTELERIANQERLTYRRWAQDPFVTLRGGDAIVLLQSYYSQRMVDYFLPLQLAEQVGSEILLKPTRLCLEGGNMLCDDDCAFIGRDLIVQNQILHRWDEEAVKAHFCKVLGVKSVQVIGTQLERPKWPADKEGTRTRQPFFHIDLLVTLGGLRKEDGRSLVFLGSTRLTQQLLEAAKMKVADIQLPEATPDVDAGLEEVRDCFPDAQYAVVELPIYCQQGVCFSWNNCLVEVYGDVRRVYLPSYWTASDDEVYNPVFQVLEAEVERRYVNAGFEVVWIRTGRFFRILASHGGSLHCATKVLRRGN